MSKRADMASDNSSSPEGSKGPQGPEDQGEICEGRRVFMEIQIKFSRADLAREFVKRHRLKGSSIPIIASYIQDTIDNHTPDDPVTPPSPEAPPPITTPGRSDILVVFEDDDAADLAREFVKRHRLKGSSIPIIASYIQDTIDNHTPDDPVTPPSPESSPSHNYSPFHNLNANPWNRPKKTPSSKNGLKRAQSAMPSASSDTWGATLTPDSKR
eukprot:CAMPEP_0173260288 /NCGR_PEP_ID=MMETSP1142-20121109/25490_1 /TAXON_ID=483371 /ORGANISM="non described non described, Strain CCMP2298" /LENGTH=212 /DNA_ID=CAMNT_0014195007 /DNA_START=117 /DNA_END=753 /DNA_ORIENTATION=+